MSTVTGERPRLTAVPTARRRRRRTAREVVQQYRATLTYVAVMGATTAGLHAADVTWSLQ